MSSVRKEWKLVGLWKVPKMGRGLPCLSLTSQNVVEGPVCARKLLMEDRQVEKESAVEMGTIVRGTQSRKQSRGKGSCGACSGSECPVTSSFTVVLGTPLLQELLPPGQSGLIPGVDGNGIIQSKSFALDLSVLRS